MNSKMMTLIFAGAMALSAFAPGAFAGTKGAGNAHSQSASAVNFTKRLPPQLVQRVASNAHGPNAVIGKRPSAVSGKAK